MTQNTNTNINNILKSFYFSNELFNRKMIDTPEQDNNNDIHKLNSIDQSFINNYYKDILINDYELVKSKNNYSTAINNIHKYTLKLNNCKYNQVVVFNVKELLYSSKLLNINNIIYVNKNSIMSFNYIPKYKGYIQNMYKLSNNKLKSLIKDNHVIYVKNTNNFVKKNKGIYNFIYV